MASVYPSDPRWPRPLGIARQARSRSAPRHRRFLATALLSSWSEGTRLPVGLDLDRLIVYVAPPFADSITRLAELVGHWRKEFPSSD